MEEVKSIKEWQKEVYSLAKEKGWYNPPKSKGESILMIMTELAEVVEELRSDEKHYYEVNGKPEGIGPELADIIIRTLDFSESLGINIEEMMIKKHEYNKSRSTRHGNKKL